MSLLCCTRYRFYEFANTVVSHDFLLAQYCLGGSWSVATRGLGSVVDYVSQRWRAAGVPAPSDCR